MGIFFYIFCDKLFAVYFLPDIQNEIGLYSLEILQNTEYISCILGFINCFGNRFRLDFFAYLKGFTSKTMQPFGGGRKLFNIIYIFKVIGKY